MGAVHILLVQCTLAGAGRRVWAHPDQLCQDCNLGWKLPLCSESRAGGSRQGHQQTGGAEGAHQRSAGQRQSTSLTAAPIASESQ